MNKNAIYKYATWARRELIARVSQKAMQYGINDTDFGNPGADSVNGYLLSATEKQQRQSLIRKIQQSGFEQAMEEAAYTWFNRFSAMRYMEVNGFLPSHIRVFTDDENNFKPQILTEAIHLELEGLRMEKVYELKEANKTEELYKYLLITQSNALGSILPGMFTRIDDYTELLFPDNLLREGSVIEQMIALIPEEDWKDVEIIGWLYQYYISEKHQEVVDPLHGKIIKKEDIPAATQLFTTDWVVKYIVDNSLGRYWIERHPESKLADKLQFFVKPKNGVIPTVNENILPEELKVLDPCCGSGHFLVYAFDVLMAIYEECGWTDREAAFKIVETNLFGLDIDDRAAQLAYFAVLMKARQYDRRILSRNVVPNVYSIPESNNISNDVIQYICGKDEDIKKNFISVINQMKDAKEYGSILQLLPIDFSILYKRFEAIADEISLFREEAMNECLLLVKVTELLSQKYDIVVTNPPFLNKFDPVLKKYVEDNYRDYKADLFSVFMVHNFEFCKEGGYCGFMSPNVWMFIKTYEALRRFILTQKNIITLIQMAKGAFFKDATVDICSFVLKNGVSTDRGLYFRLEDFKGGMDIQAQKVLEAIENPNCSYFFETKKDNYSKIPGSPIAYWISSRIFDLLSNKTINEISTPCLGMRTGDNDRFLRFWHEIDISKSSCLNLSSYLSKKWIPFNKGGGFRRWYGLNEYLVNWENDGCEIKENTKIKYGDNIGWKISNEKLYFIEGITWGSVTSGITTFRYYPRGFIFSNCGQAVIMNNNDQLLNMIGFLNTNIVVELLKVLSPTIGCESGYVAKLPYITEAFNNSFVKSCSKSNISLAKIDWDSFETSWDFKMHPFMKYLNATPEERTVASQVGTYVQSPIEHAYTMWLFECDERFKQLKANEEELNRIFIDIYGLQDELTPEVEDKDVTVRKADFGRDIRSFISYAVGCMFGRYSLDVEGLAYAGGEWDDSKYQTFPVDKDGIIPICDDEYFDDDIVGRFINFVKVVFGADTLEENLQTIAEGLGGKGHAREVIRSYFLNDFYADHLKIYQKRPIYWLFDSGKKGGFKALIYMHRYQPDTIARIRTDYVHEQQARYRTAIEGIEQALPTASNSERVKLNKRLEKLTAQAEEIRLYEEKIHHLADQMIRIDLDDGVKKNYDLFSEVLEKIK